MKRTHPKRRTFSVAGQLLGKLGEEGLAALQAELHANVVNAPQPKRRRRRRARKAVSA